MSENVDNVKPDEHQSEPPKKGIIRKIIENISVEPLVICWLLPYLLTYAAIEDLNVEKACRGFVDDSSGMSKDVCKLIVRKDMFNITCDGANAGSLEHIDKVAIEKEYPEIFRGIKDNFSEVMNFLCEVENPVQIKLSLINSIRNPISSIGPLIIILFAGPWSDKRNLRIPCMIVPFLGEAIGYLCEIK